MRELVCITSNAYAAWDSEGSQIRMVELVLVMSEPAYSLDPMGDLNKRREVSSLRLSTSPKQLRQLADTLKGIADETERLPVLGSKPKEGGAG